MNLKDLCQCKWAGRIISAFLAVMGIQSSALAAVNVMISGGAGEPLIITLPAMTWTITDAVGFNRSYAFGVGIDVQQSVPDYSGFASQPGVSGEWMTDNPHLTLTQALPDQYAFIVNTAFGPLANGVIWFGMTSSRNAENGDIITFAGGTIGNSPRLRTGTFKSGAFEVYLMGGNQYPVVSTPGIAIPEPSAAMLSFLGCLVMLKFRTR